MRSLQVRGRWVIGVAVGLGALMSPMLGSSAAWARPPLVVDDDGQQCGKASYETIAAALEAAVDGDTIRVCPGLYDEPLHITESVRIVGPVEGVNQLDCLTVDPASVGDTTRLAVLQPPAPASTDPSEPLVTLDADGAELAGLVIQGQIDEVATMDGIY
ncbi:hypothetical protein ACPW96_22365 [Micromonospora sp. DT81.3]|uniref:hypothetical protein n=1 Tax=Micromonospora sp. DT81.3 TaxID=3416523 RepID=UPI003CE9C03C